MSKGIEKDDATCPSASRNWKMEKIEGMGKSLCVVENRDATVTIKKRLTVDG